MVDVQALQGHWNEIRGEIRKRWGQLTDDDVQTFEGDLDALMGRIQEKTGDSREVIEHHLEKLTSDGSSAVAHAAKAAGHYAGQAAEAVAAAPAYVAHKLRNGYSDAEDVVRRRPGESLAVVFGTGLIAGMILGLLVRSK